jgi:hypothetical protein
VRKTAQVSNPVRSGVGNSGWVGDEGEAIEKVTATGNPASACFTIEVVAVGYRIDRASVVVGTNPVDN